MFFFFFCKKATMERGSTACDPTSDGAYCSEPSSAPRLIPQLLRARHGAAAGAPPRRPREATRVGAPHPHNHRRHCHCHAGTAPSPSPCTPSMQTRVSSAFVGVFCVFFLARARVSPVARRKGRARALRVTFSSLFITINSRKGVCVSKRDGPRVRRPCLGEEIGSQRRDLGSSASGARARVTQ